MKNKIITLSALIAFGFAGTAFALPAPVENDGPFTPKGGAAKQWQPVRIMKLVRNSDRGANSAGIDSGDVVVYDTTQFSRDGVTVRTTTTSGDGAIAGIAVTDIATSDTVSTSTSAIDDAGKRNWGFIIVHGPALADCTSGTCGAVAGNVFRTSSDAGAIGTPVATSGHYDAQNTNARIGGFFYETPAGGQARVFVTLE